MSLFQLITPLHAKRGFQKKSDVEAGKISLEMDALISEAPDFSATVTKNNVEKGADVSDHVALNPLSLTIEAVISNTPSSILKIATGKTFSDPAATAYKFLKQLYLDAQVFDFVGGFEVYKDMVITNLSPSRTAATANGLRFQAKMQQVRLVESVEITIEKVKPADRPKAAPLTDSGFQSNTPHSFKGVEPTAKVSTTSADLNAFVKGGGADCYNLSSLKALAVVP